MASKVESLVEKIEKLREDMHRLARRKGITSPEVLYISQQIDVELNNYYRLINTRKLV
ncbi:Spo0E family sporulation regulatory protein-aspartic acid phosphatase [Ammoniphilus sp. 3BR4]|uniref:Spo0E family sporulation regulatory protein-aspartic acid phosphatase n=1 Tax=Ammoniphilus sp. 3BR4 TaxID=3158265 RepID=UPI0034650F37